MDLCSNHNQIWCVNMGVYTIFDSIVGSDYDVLLCITMPPRNSDVAPSSVEVYFVRVSFCDHLGLVLPFFCFVLRAGTIGFFVA